MANYTGAPIALCETINAIKKGCNVECDILILRDGELKNEFRNYGNVLQGWNKKDVFSKIARLVGSEYAKYHYLSEVRKMRYDLVYANTIYSLAIALHLKNKFGIPFVLHLHESSYALSLSGICAEDLKSCERIITVSNFASEALIHNFSYPENKIIVAHPFSPIVKEVYQNKGEYTKKEDNTFYVGLAGTGYWIKSVDRLPLLMDIFFRKYPNTNCKFIWVGEFDKGEKEKLLFELKKFCLEDKIMLTGRVENPQDYYKQFDVFVLLSREDSFPLVALENASLYKPIICFENSSGAVEWVKEGAGDVVPYMHLDTLASSIYKFYCDETYKLTVGYRAHEIVNTMYNEDKEMKNLVSFINKFLYV